MVSRKCPISKEKLKKLFDTFDANKDGYLCLTELVAWITAVEPELNHNIKRIPDILSEYLRHFHYAVFGSRGLFYVGFNLIYEHRKRDLVESLAF